MKKSITFHIFYQCNNRNNWISKHASYLVQQFHVRQPYKIFLFHQVIQYNTMQCNIVTVLKVLIRTDWKENIGFRQCSTARLCPSHAKFPFRTVTGFQVPSSNAKVPFRSVMGFQVQVMKNFQCGYSTVVGMCVTVFQVPGDAKFPFPLELTYLVVPNTIHRCIVYPGFLAFNIVLDHACFFACNIQRKLTKKSHQALL